METVIDKLTNYLGNIANLSEEDRESVRYSIYTIWTNITKIVVYTLIAIYLDILKEYIIVLAVTSVYKVYFGGIHLKTYIGCLILSFINIFGIIYLANHIQIGLSVKVTVFIVAAIAIGLWVPADTEYRPIISKRERKKYRIIALIELIATIPVTLLISDVYSNIIILSLVLTIVLISPVTYKLLRVNHGDKY